AGVNSSAIGMGAVASSDNTIAQGLSASIGKNSLGAIAIGQNAVITGTTVTSSNDAIAIGTASSVKNGDRAVAVGYSAYATWTDSVAVGTSATAAGFGAVALGTSSVANSTGALAVGLSSSAGGWGTAVGPNAAALNQSTAIGNGAVAGHLYGPTNTWKQVGAVAVGNRADANGNYAVSLGWYASATGDNATALGPNATTTVASGVALGHNATADRAGMNGATELFSNATVASTQGAVSVGAAGNERQIINVAGGTQDTDAVNVRQLKASNQQIVDVIGGDTYIDSSTGEVKGPFITIGGDTYNTVADAIEGVDLGAVKYDRDAGGSVNYDSITLAGGADGTKITNVAAGDVSETST
ncbi:hypothetical protein ACDA63_20120, partial [Uliginosibacterium sp. sgz301328]